MTCEEFRTELHIWLDTRAQGAASSSMQQHAASCSGCGHIMYQMHSLETLLRRQTVREAGPELLATLHAIGSQRRNPLIHEEVWQEAKQALRWLIPSCILFGLAQFAPASLQFWIDLAFSVTAGGLWWSGVVGLHPATE